MKSIITELRALSGNTKGMLFLLCFRISSWIARDSIRKAILFPIRFFYKLFFQWCLGIDISDKTIIGNNFNVYHGQGIVIHENVRVGDNVTIRQNTTIGNAKADFDVPRIGDNVSIGANSVIIGKITIGNNVIIGAGSVVVANVPANVVVVGNPARIIKTIE